MSFRQLYFEQKKKQEYYHNFSIANFHRCKIAVLLIYIVTYVAVFGVHFAQTIGTEP